MDAVINRNAEDLDDCKKLLEDLMRETVSLLPEMMEDFDEFPPELEAQLKDSMLEVAKIKIEIDGFKKASLETSNKMMKLENDGKEAELKDFDIEGVLTEQLKKVKSPAPEKDEKYKELTNLLLANKGEGSDLDVEGDDDMAMAVSSTVAIKDPISQQEIQDPVKNKKCGHTYERTSILDYIKMREGKSCKCPMVGCINKDEMTPNSLIDDIQLKKRIARDKLRREKEKAQQPQKTSHDLTVD